MGNSRSFNMKVLAVSHLVFGVLFGLIALFMGLVLLLGVAEESGSLAIISLVISLPLAIVLLVSSVGIFARKLWAMPYLLISGILLLFVFPIGSIIGVMTLIAHADLRSIRRRRR